MADRTTVAMDRALYNSIRELADAIGRHTGFRPGTNEVLEAVLIAGLPLVAKKAGVDVPALPGPETTVP